MSEVVLQCEGLSRIYDDGDRSVTVLRSVDLTLLAGEKIAVVGGSGSGKSTLLNLLGHEKPADYDESLITIK